MKEYEDELWLTNAKPDTTEAELENFLERVAIKIANGTSVPTARAEAYAEIFKGRNEVRRGQATA